MLDQIESCRQNGIASLTRGVGNLIAKIANDVPADHLLFCPSECNSADNLTRIRTVDDIFSKNSTWFTPHLHFNQPGVPKFERVQMKKVVDDQSDKNNGSQAALTKNKEMGYIAAKNLAKVSPEETRNLGMCKCKHEPTAKSKTNHICSECYLDIPPKVQEGCAVSNEPVDAKDEPDPVASPSTLEETKIFLDAQYAKTTNIRTILSSVHHMIETHSKNE